MDPGTDGVLRCGTCAEETTRSDAAVEIAGAHARTFRNPAGWSFGVACYREAAGCTPIGEATLEHTWFPGYAWRLLRCTGCRSHLGWRFDSGDDAFAALITARLRT